LQQARVLEVLEPVLAGPLSRHDRASALRLAGCAHMVLGHRDAAIARFRESFALEPDASLEPQLASPNARSLFEIARGQWLASLIPDMETRAPEIAKLSLDVHAPAAAQGGRPVQIAVGLGDPTRLVARVELSYRKRGQPEYALLTQPRAPALSFVIPA